jgi:pimeloyl-ACP methyl ester carboxylesterase
MNNRWLYLLVCVLTASLLLPVGAAEELVQSARFTVVGQDGKNQTAIGIWPKAHKKGERWPIVIAFSGMTESREGPVRGYLAWPEKYGLLEAFSALLTPPLAPAAFGGLVRGPHLQAINAELKARPFQGVFVVGVYTPDLLAPEGREERTAAYADWVAGVLVPRVRDVFPVTSGVAREVGVDGVSLGGAVALEVGLRHPEVFSTIGALQPAVRGREAELAQRASDVAANHAIAIRLASSDGDPLLPVVRTLSAQLRKRQTPHGLVVTPGGHDYAYNRGPGVIELLRFHDHALRSSKPRAGLAAESPK